MTPQSEKSRIKKIDVWPIDISLTDDFVISQGAISTAENAFVRLTLEDGTEGYGELAPFEELTGETRDDGVSQIKILAEDLIGMSVNGSTMCVGNSSPGYILQAKKDPALVSLV